MVEILSGEAIIPSRIMELKEKVLFRMVRVKTVQIIFCYIVLFRTNLDLSDLR